MAVIPPEPPKNTYDGAEQSAEAQKAALTRLLAEQGSLGMQQIQNRGQDAAAIAQQAQAAYGNGQGVPYQTFSRDAEQARVAQEQHMARIGASNAAYMDQVKAAIPLQRADIDAMYGAMKMEYDERQREREAEEARRQQEAADRRNASAAQVKAIRSEYDKMRESLDAENRIRMEEAAKIPANQRPLSAQQALGVKQFKWSRDDAFGMLGFEPASTKALWEKNSNVKSYERLVMDAIAEAKQADASWNDVIAAVRGAANDPEMLLEYGVGAKRPMLANDYEKIIQPLLVMYGSEWGVPPREWVQGWRAPQNQRSAPAGGL